jgi:hypothetical protein
MLNFLFNIFERAGGFIGLSGSTAVVIVLLLSYVLQTLLVIILICKFFQVPETREPIPFWKALGFAILFTTATPVAALVAGTLVLYSFPYTGWLWDPVSRLPEFDPGAAISSRPLAWVLTIFATILSYFLITNHYKKSKKIMLQRHYLWIVVCGILAHFVMQLSLYAIFFFWGDG